jgi:GDP-4-dehydro-6-deoxy-D-mannose reductase
LLAKSGKSGEVYNICSGYSVSLRDFLQKMIAVHGVSVEAREDAGLPANPVRDIFGSIQKIQRDTGWTPQYRWDESIEKLL